MPTPVPGPTGPHSSRALAAPGCKGPHWLSLPLQKFVSTTIRPTLMPYSELYNWDSCAQFVSDFLTMVPLPDPLKPVSVIHRRAHVKPGRACKKEAWPDPGCSSSTQEVREPLI